MRVSRRHVLRLAAGAAALRSASGIAWAQSYPLRPVRLIVGLAPGGSADILARLMGQWLTERLGQQFVVDNRPGAGGNIATEAVVNAPADGHTLLLFGPSSAINATLYDNLNFNFIRDIVPVGSIVRDPIVMVVNPAVPATTIPGFLAYAKANSGKISMASPGIGTANHMTGELFKIMAGVDLIHVPYRGGAPAAADLLSGRVQTMFGNLSFVIEYVRSGKLRALAVTTATRVPALPDIPTVSEFVPGYEASGWFGIGAPGKTPGQIIEKLNRELNAGVANPVVKARIAELGAVPMPMSPAEFGNFIVDETEKWGKVIRAAGIKPV
jgi:tripartite-type tricarboxylate transporter receptor subunit TctC